MNSVDLPYILGFRNYWAQAAVGAALIGLYFVAGTVAMYAWIVKKKGVEFMRKWGPVRFGLTAFLFLNMVAVIVKMGLRLGMNVQYILVTPWINV